MNRIYVMPSIFEERTQRRSSIAFIYYDGFIIGPNFDANEHEVDVLWLVQLNVYQVK